MPDSIAPDTVFTPVHVDTAFGFVFVCLATAAQGGPPPPVALTWGRLGEELKPYRTEEMVPLGPITCDVWNVDWKIAMDNYLESLPRAHRTPRAVPHVHAGLRRCGHGAGGGARGELAA